MDPDLMSRTGNGPSKAAPDARAIASVILGLLMQVAAALAPAPAGAAQDLAALCDRAAGEASRQTGVPLSVLRAISLAETGRKQAG
mgnify:CR=1 FL=1